MFDDVASEIDDRERADCGHCKKRGVSICLGLILRDEADACEGAGTPRLHYRAVFVDKRHGGHIALVVESVVDFDLGEVVVDGEFL